MEMPLLVIGTIAAILSAVLVGAGIARSRRTSEASPPGKEISSKARGWTLSNAVGAVSVLLLLVANIFITVDVVTDRKEPGILFLLWILFAGGAMLFAARIFSSKKMGHDD
jgi:hypothetical protein